MMIVSTGLSGDSSDLALGARESLCPVTLSGSSHSGLHMSKLYWALGRS